MSVGAVHLLFLSAYFYLFPAIAYVGRRTGRSAIAPHFEIQKF